MAKKKKRSKKRKRQQPQSVAPSGMTWMGKEGLHALLPGEAPSSEDMALFNDNFRKELRNSPLWDEMVEKFGADEAEKLLKQVKIELKR